MHALWQDTHSVTACAATRQGIRSCMVCAALPPVLPCMRNALAGHAQCCSMGCRTHAMHAQWKARATLLPVPSRPPDARAAAGRMQRCILCSAMHAQRHGARSAAARAAAPARCMRSGMVRASLTPVLPRGCAISHARHMQGRAGLALRPALPHPRICCTRPPTHAQRRRARSAAARAAAPARCMRSGMVRTALPPVLLRLRDACAATWCAQRCRLCCRADVLSCMRDICRAGQGLHCGLRYRTRAFAAPARRRMHSGDARAALQPVLLRLRDACAAAGRAQRCCPCCNARVMQCSGALAARRPAPPSLRGVDTSSGHQGCVLRHTGVCLVREYCIRADSAPTFSI